MNSTAGITNRSFLGHRTVAACTAVAISLAWSTNGLTQDLPDETAEDDTPQVVPQQESVTIEPYTGPPIFLPEAPEPPPATRVEEKSITDYYDKDKEEQPRVTRGVRRYSDDSVKNHGPYEEFYESGQTFCTGSYDEGAQVGEWKFYHPDGTPAKTVTYVDGRPNGPIEVRRADGTLRAKREYTDGKRTGTWLVFGDDGEQKLIESTYADGKAEGVWQVWYPDGKQRRQVPFSGGKQHGTIVEWDKEGNKRAEVSYVNGVREGPSRLWTTGGKSYEQTYKDGKLVSTKEIEN